MQIVKPPLSFFWIAYFNDSTAIAQFEPETGQEVLWSTVEALKHALMRVEWRPFSPKMKRLLAASGQPVRVLPQQAAMSVELGPDCDLIIKRVRHVSMGLSKNGHGDRSTLYVLGRIRGDALEITARDEQGHLVPPPGGITI